MKKQIQNIMIIGIDLVALSRSAQRAGFKVYAVDYFGDIDLIRASERCRSIVHQELGKSTGRIESNFDPVFFYELAESFTREEQIDAILLSSGLDDNNEILLKLNNLAEILGNHPKKIRKTRDKLSLFKDLKKLGIPHPYSTVVDCVEEAKKIVRDIGLPVVFKPLEGFGGATIRKIENSSQVEKEFPLIYKLSPIGVLIQKYVEGHPISISFMASDKETRMLSINEQLLGIREFHQTEPFGYCGNIVPFLVNDLVEGECERLVQRIGSHFELVGSNGIDLVLSEEGVPYVIEVNPRFQGTLECVERVLGVNLVKIHIDACINGSLPPIQKIDGKFVTRLILYAPRRVVAADLTSFSSVRDIPLPGAIIEENEPLCSVVTEGTSRIESLSKAKHLAGSIYSLCV